MKPLNSKERNKAFFKVVGLSAISCIIVLILGFTYLKDDSLSENRSKNVLGDYKSLNEFHKNTFEPGMNEVKALIDSIPILAQSNGDLPTLHQTIVNKLVDIQTKIDKQENLESKDEMLNYKPFYLEVVNTCRELRVALENEQKKANDLEDCQKNKGGAVEDVAKLEKEIARLEKVNEGLQAQVQAGGSSDNLIKNLNDSLTKYKSDLRFIEIENNTLKSEIERLKK